MFLTLEEECSVLMKSWAEIVSSGRSQGYKCLSMGVSEVDEEAPVHLPPPDKSLIGFLTFRISCCIL